MPGIGPPNAGAALNSCAKGAAWQMALEVLEKLPEWQVASQRVGFSKTCDFYQLVINGLNDLMDLMDLVDLMGDLMDLVI